MKMNFEKEELKEIFNEFELSDLLEVCNETGFLQDRIYEIMLAIPDGNQGISYEDAVHKNIVELMFQLYNSNVIGQFIEFVLKPTIESKMAV